MLPKRGLAWQRDHAVFRRRHPWAGNRVALPRETMTTNCTVAIDARLVGGTAGGVEHLVAGLARGFSGLSDGPEQYLFLTHRLSQSWLLPYISGPCRVVDFGLSPRFAAKVLIARLSPTLRRSWWRSLERLVRSGERPLAGTQDRELERLGADLVHFTRQDAFPTRVPGIYHPHDLLHLHFPRFFSRQERKERDTIYGEHCRRARMVAVSSSWTKDDLVASYGLPESQVQVVPLAPTLEFAPEPTVVEVERARRQLHLPDRYVLYPAQFWPHKNHAGLVEACAVLRDRHHLLVPMVLVGRRTEHTDAVISRIRELDLEGLVRIPGYVSTRQLRCMYSMATCLAIPTMFEAASFPMWDAFLTGVPVAASTVTSLPRQAGGAAVLFDPTSPQEIAEALASLWSSENLREELVTKGREVVRPLTWERTARHFRAHYRRILELPMTRADRELLDAPPLL